MKTNEKLKKANETILSIIRKWFLAGLLVSLPLILTFYIVTAVVDFFDALIIDNLVKRETWLKSIPGFGLIVSAIIVLIIGFIATNFFGRFILKITEGILFKIPLVKNLYSTIKQIFETVLSSQSNSFKEVVLIEYPRVNCWTLAFITSTATGEIQQKTKDETLSVFIPTTPNPTSGFLLFVPKKDVIKLDMKPETAMKLIISGGVLNEKNDLKIESLTNKS